MQRWYAGLIVVRYAGTNAIVSTTRCENPCLPVLKRPCWRGLFSTGSTHRAMFYSLPEASPPASDHHRRRFAERSLSPCNIPHTRLEVSSRAPDRRCRRFAGKVDNPSFVCLYPRRIYGPLSVSVSVSVSVLIVFGTRYRSRYRYDTDTDNGLLFPIHFLSRPDEGRPWQSPGLKRRIAASRRPAIGGRSAHNAPKTRRHLNIRPSCYPPADRSKPRQSCQQVFDSPQKQRYNPPSGKQFHVSA